MASRILSLVSVPYHSLKKVYAYVFVRAVSSTLKKDNSTVDQEEVTKFTDQAINWWNGPKYEILHSMNSLRVPLVRDGILETTGSRKRNAYPLKGYKILDVGCGGGIFSEPLARLGASVTGLDPGQENIDIAAKHASQDVEIKNNLKYVCDTVESFAATSKESFDAVVCSEVIEHVANVDTFIKSCVKLTNDGGSLFFTTINRNILSYITSIIGAEYIFGLIPRGTHDWNKFVTPEELSVALRAKNCQIVSVDGLFYNPVIKKWSWIGCSANMYALHAVK